MEVALTAPRNLPSSLRLRINISVGPGHSGPCRCSLSSRSQHQKFRVKCSVKVPTAEHFGERNKLTTYRHMLLETLWKSLPEPVKEFPWKKAEDLLLHRLLHLGKKALKWFLVLFLLFSSVSDVFLSFSRNRELMIPLGLFIGFTVAGFLVETFKEFLHSSKKDLAIGELLCIGTFFACIKLSIPNVALPGRTLLTHISNGGLMQVLWLVQKLQDTEGEKTAESLSSSEKVDS